MKFDSKNQKIVFLVSSSSDDEMLLPAHQPPSIEPFDSESPPETRQSPPEEQFALTDRKIRARPYNPKRKPEKSALKSLDYQQQKNVRGFKCDREIMLHKEGRTNPYLTNQVRRSGNPSPRIKIEKFTYVTPALMRKNDQNNEKITCEN